MAVWAREVKRREWAGVAAWAVGVGGERAALLGYTGDEGWLGRSV